LRAMYQVCNSGNCRKLRAGRQSAAFNQARQPEESYFGFYH
jgi:hypothetical protein